MLRSVLTKTIRDNRWTILFWSLGVIGMSLLMMNFYHSFSEGGFDQAIKSLPKSFQNSIGNVANLKTVPGYVSQQVFALRIPLLTLIMGIMIFTGFLAGDEGDGTLQTLLAQPVSRLKVYIEKYLAGLIVSLLVCLAAVAGVLIGLALIHEHMGLLRLVQAAIGVWILVLVFGTFGYAVGAISGKRGLAGSLTGLITFASYLLTSFAPNVSSIKTIERFSPFHYYNNPAIASYGIKGSNALVMVAIILVPLVIGAVVFVRRDIYQR